MNPERRTFPGTPESVPEARSFVAGHFSRDSCSREKATLLASEIITNAVRHVGGKYTVTVKRQEEFVRVLVEDCGGASTVPWPRASSEMREGGRGLALVDAISHAWGASLTRYGGTVVWFDVPAVGAFG